MLKPRFKSWLPSTCARAGLTALLSATLRRPAFLAVSLLASLVLAAPAGAADPIMPLSEVRSGMRCTGLSVIRGVEPVPFDVEIVDIVEGGGGIDEPRILLRVSGPAVDETGIGPGFSGSPIFCRDAHGRQANAGAISESIGEFGGKVALATPIETILGNPVDAPSAAKARPRGNRRVRRLAEPLTVSGLSRPLSSALARAARRRGRTILAAPPGPLASFPPQTLRPGSAVGVGYSSGDLTIGAVGTVAYVDGDRVWSFGHELDAAGRRSLLLQDAYVYRVINNPIQLGEIGTTYKLAAAAHDIGTVSNDALSAVVGRLGALPRTVAVRVTARDQDTGARESVDSDVADETDADDPLGLSLVSLIGPLAVTQAAAGVLRSSPPKVTGEMCANIGVRELGKPLRICNRYVGAGGGGSGGGELSNVVASGAGADLESALTLITGYTGRALHITSVEAGVRVHRGADLAYMRDLKLPRRVRPGQRVIGRLTVQRLRGPKQRLRIPLRMPSRLSRGAHRIILSGEDADFGEDDLFEELIIEFEGEEGEDDSRGPDRSALDEGPQSLSELRKAVEEIERYDGVKLFVDRTRGQGVKAYRDPQQRLSGRVSARVVVGRRR